MVNVQFVFSESGTTEVANLAVFCMVIDRRFSQWPCHGLATIFSRCPMTRALSCSPLVRTRRRKILHQLLPLLLLLPQLQPQLQHQKVLLPRPKRTPSRLFSPGVINKDQDFTCPKMENSEGAFPSFLPAFFLLEVSVGVEATLPKELKSAGPVDDDSDGASPPV